MPSDPVKPPAGSTPPAASSDPLPPSSAAAPATYSAMAVAVNTGVVGVPCAALAVWAIETYWQPGGTPLPDWVAGALGTGIATAATYLYHVGSTLFQKWINAKLDEP